MQCLWLCVLLIVSSAHADTLHVPSDYATVQAAIDDAVDGDEIVLAPGEYRESARTLGKSITIRSTFPYDDDIVAATVFRGSGADGGMDDEPALRVDPSREARPVFLGLTFTDWRRNTQGSDDRGGGAIVVGRSFSPDEYTGAFPIFDRCIFTDNSVDFSHGGAVAVLRGTSRFVDCLFERNRTNTTEFGGGGAILAGGGVEVIRCVFERNRAHTGGALYSQPGTLEVRDSEFIDNFAGEDGSAVGGDSSFLTVFDSCRFERNRSNSGGVIGVDGNANLHSCILVGNSSRNGNAISGARSRPQQLVIQNCTIVANRERFGRASIRVAPRTFFIVQSCIFGPIGATVVDEASGIFGLNASHTLAPAAFEGTGNLAGAASFVRPPSDGGDGFGDDPGTMSIDESLNDDYGDLRMTPGSITIDSGGAGLALLYDVLDADGDGTASEFPTTDLAGQPRYTDNPDVPNTGVPFGGSTRSVVDMGAYETPGETCAADLKKDGLLNARDINNFVRGYLSQRRDTDLNQDGLWDSTDINMFIASFMDGC